MSCIVACSLWQDGVLTSQLLEDLSSHMDPGSGSATRGSTHWFVLEGGVSADQLDSLLSYVSPKSALTLSNGRAAQISDATRFILEVSVANQRGMHFQLQ